MGHSVLYGEELQIEADQPKEPAISGKKIVSIGFLEQVVQLSENHARSCTTGRLNIDREIRSGLKSTIILKCIICEKTFSCSTIDKKIDINKEEFLSVINIPPLSGTTFYTGQDELSQFTLLYTYIIINVHLLNRTAEIESEYILQMWNKKKRKAPTISSDCDNKEHAPLPKSSVSDGVLLFSLSPPLLRPIPHVKST
ncbi:hypothetical protein RN001_002082 [Aquatica leii]|uniref:Uncharacterized protein n=1 Tax=Aquatica leii TaxID=1421715 RepID=A0AAN7SD25_9COLE|nr:hypothetical protein RN001_002082 [Aquatica leii]